VPVKKGNTETAENTRTIQCENILNRRPADLKEEAASGQGRDENKGCVSTIIERKTRWYTAIKMPDWSEQYKEHTIRVHGKEFSCYKVRTGKTPSRVYC